MEMEFSPPREHKIHAADVLTKCFILCMFYSSFNSPEEKEMIPPLIYSHVGCASEPRVNNVDAPVEKR